MPSNGCFLIGNTIPAFTSMQFLSSRKGEDLEYEPARSARTQTDENDHLPLVYISITSGKGNPVMILRADYHQGFTRYIVKISDVSRLCTVWWIHRRNFDRSPMYMFFHFQFPCPSFKGHDIISPVASNFQKPARNDSPYMFLPSLPCFKSCVGNNIDKVPRACNTQIVTC